MTPATALPKPIDNHPQFKPIHKMTRRREMQSPSPLRPIAIVTDLTATIDEDWDSVTLYCLPVKG